MTQDHDHSHRHDHSHDHDHSVVEGLAHADAHCAAKGVRLTDMRRQVLEALIDSRKALGAYDLIDIVARKGTKRPAPVTIYRALDFLIETGLAHRIESHNAFVACLHEHGQGDAVIFFICQSCQRIAEETSQSIHAGLSLLARKRGFDMHANVLEIEGRCSACRYTPMTA